MSSQDMFDLFVQPDFYTPLIQDADSTGLLSDLPAGSSMNPEDPEEALRSSGTDLLGPSSVWLGAPENTMAMDPTVVSFFPAFSEPENPDDMLFSLDTALPGSTSAVLGGATEGSMVIDPTVESFFPAEPSLEQEWFAESNMAMDPAVESFFSAEPSSEPMDPGDGRASLGMDLSGSSRAPLGATDDSMVVDPALGSTIPAHSSPAPDVPAWAQGVRGDNIQGQPVVALGSQTLPAPVAPYMPATKDTDITFYKMGLKARRFLSNRFVRMVGSAGLLSFVACASARTAFAQAIDSSVLPAVASTPTLTVSQLAPPHAMSEEIEQLLARMQEGLREGPFLGFVPHGDRIAPSYEPCKAIEACQPFLDTMGVPGLALSGCYVQNQRAAELIVDLVQLGTVPCLTRRLDSVSKFKAGSGFVYVYKQGTDESHIRRWTDDRKWTPSRKGEARGINIYREVQVQKRGPSPPPEREASPAKSCSYRGDGISHVPVCLGNCETTLFVPPQDVVFSPLTIEEAASLVGPLTTGCNFVVHGLVKRTYTVCRDQNNTRVPYGSQTAACSAWTVVSYFTIRDIVDNKVLPVSSEALRFYDSMPEALEITDLDNIAVKRSLSQGIQIPPAGSATQL